MSKSVRYEWVDSEVFLRNELFSCGIKDRIKIYATDKADNELLYDGLVGDITIEMLREYEWYYIGSWRYADEERILYIQEESPLKAEQLKFMIKIPPFCLVADKEEAGTDATICFLREFIHSELSDCGDNVDLKESEIEVIEIKNMEED